jgi:GNAT superfamily N-acetyltransferase
VAERDGRLVGCLQLTVIPGLGRRGATRSIIEAVRVAATERGGGLGTRLITWAIEESRRLGVDLVQLTSDRTRTDAHRFYERLGFVPSHLGFKLPL